ncbi:hypothetical protein C27AD_04227 [Salinisphaera hydrothermalis C27AD]
MFFGVCCFRPTINAKTANGGLGFRASSVSVHHAGFFLVLSDIDQQIDTDSRRWRSVVGGAGSIGADHF